MTRPIDELSPTEALAEVESTLRRRREAEVTDLLLIAHWADLHASEPRRKPGRRWCGEDRLVQLGGDGSPAVQELCLPKLAIARRSHTLSTRAAMADVLDLRHRLPQTWGVVLSGEAEVWVARKVAVLSRELSADAATSIVDAAVAEALASESPSRVLEIAQAKVIEADTAAHAAKVEAQRRRRYVGLSRTDEFGLRHVIARVEAGDAVWIDALVERVADVLAVRVDLRPDTPAEISRDELRSLAFGWLARPAELLRLLAGDRAPLPALRPRATLYVHLHQSTLAGETSGVARVEGLGPQLLSQVQRLLAHTHVTVKPVIDLHDQVSVNSYEFPESLKERVHLTHPAEVFPHASTRSRHVDLDHVVPFEAHGPPGQTGVHNAAPLSRSPHRAKTHLGYRCRRTAKGEYVWRTPHGLYRITDARGTHPLDEESGRDGPRRRRPRPRTGAAAPSHRVTGVG